MQLSGMGGLRRGGEALKKEDEDWKKREKDSGAALYEENYIVSQGAKEKEFTSVKLKDEIVAFSQRMEFLMGVDVDGDGIVGNDMRKDKDVARGRENLDKAAHDEERVLEAERWSARLKAVEEDVREAKLEKARETVRVPTVGKKDNLRRHEAQTRDFDVYHRSVEHTVENRTNVRVTLQTRGQLFIALQNLGDAVKKSAQLARNETQGDMTDEMMKGAMKDVHSFQVRSFVVGGPMQFAKAYCPKVFCRLRSHFGLSYESFVRLVDTFVFGDGGRGSERRGGILNSGDFFFSSKAQICYKLVNKQERKTILDMLVDYEKHMRDHPFSLLPQYYGLYRLEQADGTALEFVVHNNIFHTVDTIQCLYDIKGCRTRKTGIPQRIGHVYLNPLGSAEDRRGLGASEDVPLDTFANRFLNDTNLHKIEFWKGALVLHKEQRHELIAALREDTLWLSSQGLYNYALLIGLHQASPWDSEELRINEFHQPSRFGGITAIENTYHVGLVGPFKKWDAAARAAHVLRTGTDSSSLEPPDHYALRLREAVFECILEFDVNTDYVLFRKRQVERFRALVQYDKALESGGELPPQRREWLRTQFAVGNYALALEPLGIDPATVPPDSALAFVRQDSCITERRNFFGKFVPVKPKASGQGTQEALDSPASKSRGFGLSFFGRSRAASTALAAAPPAQSKRSRDFQERLEKFRKSLQKRKVHVRSELSVNGLGLGIVLGSTKSERIVVSRCLPRRAAALSGKLKTGDIVLQVRRVRAGKWVEYDVSSLNCKGAAELLKGEEGELIGLKLRRVHAITAEQANLSQYDGVEAINEDFEVVLRNGYEKDEGTAYDRRFSDFVDTEAEEGVGGVTLTEEERMEREYEHLEKVRELEELGGDEWFRGEEATAKAVQETAEFQLRRLQAQIQLTRDELENERYRGGHAMPEYLSPAEELVPLEKDLDLIDAMLSRCVHGAFFIYRSPELPEAPMGFQTLGVAYYDHSIREVKHNLIYMVKRDPEHTRQLMSRGELGQHPDDPWLPLNQHITTNEAPWLVSPAWLQEQGEMFPSLVQFVAAFPMFRTLVLDTADVGGAPLRPPPPVVVRTPTPEPELLVDPTLYDVWCARQKKLHGKAHKLLHRDLDTGVPVHSRTQFMSDNEKTYIPLSAAELSNIVLPTVALDHLRHFYPLEVPHIVEQLELALENAANAEKRIGRNALSFPLAGSNEMRSKLFILKALADGLAAADWRERVFILRDGILCFASEKKKSILKRVCDVCTVSTCLVLNKEDLGPHENGIMMTYSEQGDERNVTLATYSKTDCYLWLEAMSKYSPATKFALANFEP